MTKRLGTLLLIGSIVFMVACAGGDPSDHPALARNGYAQIAITDEIAASNIWPFDGDGRATTGHVDLRFLGFHSLTDEAVSFDGATGFAASLAPGPVASTRSFSVAAWAHLGDEAKNAAVISQLGGVATAFELGVSKGRWSFAMTDADTSAPVHTIRASAGAATADPSTWVHLVGVYDDGARKLRLYIDGAPVATTAFGSPWKASGALTIGRSQVRGGYADFWPGAVADVRVFRGAVGHAQVRELFEGTRPASSPPPLASSPTGYACPANQGQCLGPLAPGTYRTSTFAPTITYKVPDGWTNGEDLPGNFLLQLEGDNRYLGVYLNVGAPRRCQEELDPRVGQSVKNLRDWLVTHPGVNVSNLQPVKVGGLRGVSLDVAMKRSWTRTCPWSEGQPTIPLIVGAGPSSVLHALFPGFEERLYLLAPDRRTGQAHDLDWYYGGENIVIEVGPEGGSLEDYLHETQPIVESLRFGSG